MIVGLEDRSPEVELDNRLNLVDRPDLTFVVGLPASLRRDVGGKLDDLIGPPGYVEDGVIARLYPYITPAFPEAMEQACLEPTFAKLLPEL